MSVFKKKGKDAEAPPVDEVEGYRMPIMEHIAELRKKLIVTMVAIGVGVIGASVFARQIFDFLVDPMKRALIDRAQGDAAEMTPDQVEAMRQSFNSLVITDPMEGVITYLKVAILAGVIVASPVVFHQLWSFVAPGLYKNEKRMVLPLVISSTLLFLLGSSFGYFVIFEYGFAFFLSVLDTDTGAAISLNSYLSTATKLLGAFGVSFQLPVLIFFLSRLGLINARDMIKFFRYGVVIIFAVSALITPPDPMTQTLMAGPLILLYVLSIGIAWAFSTKPKQSEEDADEES